MDQNNNQTHYQQPMQQPIPQPIHLRPIQTKNKFLTFVFALLPGAGQMYHGLMKKGISMMLLFWGTIGIAIVTYIPVITLILPIIWFYSFFDAVNRMNVPVHELRLLKDDFILKFDMPKNPTLAKVFAKRHLWIGWGLIFIGTNALVGAIGDRILWNTDIMAYKFLEETVKWVPIVLVPIACFIIGIKLIMGSAKQQNRPTEMEMHTND